MKRVLSFILMCFLLIPVCSLKSNATVLVIDGKSNIYGAGHAKAPTPGGGNGGNLPPSYSFSPGPNKTLTFSSVTGSVSLNGGNAWWGPDGYGLLRNSQPYGGLSGINNFYSQSLVGVFLDSTEPIDPSPAPLSFDYTALSHSFLDLYPDINQVFFIGDGLTETGSGQVQTFHVPSYRFSSVYGFY